MMALEIAVLLIRSGRNSRVRRAVDLMFAFAPGVFLLLALRAALTGADLIWVVALIAASFPFHLADLVRRRM
ncbi:MAG: hypothetical protein H7124_14625 [Phycisphaerales bacterium]|nr:hypothetical protein [Hyphomonadaceae bacterium]